MATVNWSLQHYTDTAANFTASNPTLLAGQLGIETDGLTTTPKFKIGDGSSTWTALPYFYGGSASAQDLNNVLSVGSVTSGQDMTITANDKIKFGTGNAVIFNDSNVIDPSHVIIASNPSYTGHTHLMVKDGANEWHDESAGAFTSIMVGSVPNNAIQLDDGNDKINIFSGANGLNLQNDTYLNSVTASRLLSTDSNKKIAPLTGTGIVTLTAGVIGYDTNTYLTTSAAALAYQPLDSDLTSWAGVTRASGFDTFVATPSSANLASLLTDKTGTGVNVFGTSPTFTTDITTPLIIGGSAVGSNITYKSTSGTGTTTAAAHTFTGGTNGGTTIATLYNSGQVNIGNYATPTNQRLVTIGQDTGWLTIGSCTDLTSQIGLFFNNTTFTFANAVLRGTTTATVLNVPDSAGQVDIRAANVSMLNINRAGNSTPFFTFNNPAFSAQSSSTEITNFKVNGATKTWSAGAITTQRWNYFTANTAAFASASTITNSYGLYVEAATAGTNATITNNWAAGFSGNAQFIVGTDTNGIKLQGWTSNTAFNAIYMNQATPSATNYAIVSDGTTTYYNAPTTLQLLVNGATKLSFSTSTITVTDTLNLALGSTTGNKIGTATTQKLGFWNATPIVQPTTAVAAATFVANTSGIANDTATFDGYTIGQVVKALRNVGLLA